MQEAGLAPPASPSAAFSSRDLEREAVERTQGMFSAAVPARRSSPSIHCVAGTRTHATGATDAAPGAAPRPPNSIVAIPKPRAGGGENRTLRDGIVARGSFGHVDIGRTKVTFLLMNHHERG